MNRWPHEVTPDTTAEIAKYVKCANWQSIRLSMKGVSTESKLIILDAYRTRMMKLNGGKLLREHEVQINNYLKALRRGGQLNLQDEVQR